MEINITLHIKYPDGSHATFIHTDQESIWPMVEEYMGIYQDMDSSSEMSYLCKKAEDAFCTIEQHLAEHKEDLLLNIFPHPAAKPNTVAVLIDAEIIELGFMYIQYTWEKK